MLYISRLTSVHRFLTVIELHVSVQIRLLIIRINDCVHVIGFIFVCLFVCLFGSHSRIFHSYGVVTIVGEEVQNLKYALHS